MLVVVFVWLTGAYWFCFATVFCCYFFHDQFNENFSYFLVYFGSEINSTYLEVQQPHLDLVPVLLHNLEI